MTEARSDDWEKKSERFEVRLPHATKAAFQQACTEQGDTPSEAVRRSIDSYLGGKNFKSLPNAASALGHVLRENWKPTLAAFAIGFPIAYLVTAG